MTALLMLSSLNIFLQGCARPSSEEEWRTLFNGKDLSGWQLLNGQHQVEVENGVIVGTCIQGKPNGFLATKEKFDDFILEIEVKPDLLMHNSGVQFRSNSFEEYRNGRVHGYQAEVDVTPQEWSGGIYDEARRGWLYILEDEDDPAKDAYKNNRWNKYRIEAIGNTIRIWVNGIPTAHLVDDETSEGFIGLQFHANSRPTTADGNHQVRFRNIRIKTENLEPSPWDDTYVVNLIPNHLSAQEKAQGFSLLWDGETTEGWRGIDTPDLPETGWQINDGVLTLTSENETSDNGKGGIMITQQQYGPFELKFDFKQHQEEAEPGIAYFNQDSDQEALYGRLAAKKTKGVGEWNHGVIKYYPDNKVEYWLNQYKVREFYRDPEKPFKGRILLRDQGDSVSYRSIKIRELD